MVSVIEEKTAASVWHSVMCLWPVAWESLCGAWSVCQLATVSRQEKILTLCHPVPTRLGEPGDVPVACNHGLQHYARTQLLHGIGQFAHSVAEDVAHRQAKFPSDALPFLFGYLRAD